MTLVAIPQPAPLALFSLGDMSDATSENLVKWRNVVVPSALFALAVNVVTQGMCIRGVNRLTSVSGVPVRSLDRDSLIP